MSPTISAIEQRLSELKERLRRLGPLTERGRGDFDADPYLRDIVERNLEVAAQCCIDICNRIIVVENASRPVDYYGAILQGAREQRIHFQNAVAGTPQIPK